MNPIHFFTLGYYSEYLLIGIIIGIIIGIYAFFRVRYALNDSKLSKNKIIISTLLSIFAFICCLNVWSNAAVYTLYIFLCSLFADIIRLIVKYPLKDKYLKFIPKLHKRWASINFFHNYNYSRSIWHEPYWSNWIQYDYTKNR